MSLPALVSPGPELTREELVRYARQISLPQIGVEGQRRLKESRVLVLGAGGLGSPVLQYLAGAGVGVIGIVDHDVVEVSNLHRQVVHPLTSARSGVRKVASAAAALRALNPLVEVVEHDVEITPSNVLELVSEYDVVVDGTDTFEVGHIVDAACALVGKPIVWGSVLRFDGQVTVFWATAPGELARTMSDLFPTAAADADAESCAVAGVVGPACGAVGSLMAGEVLKLLVGFGTPLLGRLLVLDALDATWSEVPFSHVERRPGRSSAARGASNIGEPYSYANQGAAGVSPATRLFERQGAAGSGDALASGGSAAAPAAAPAAPAAPESISVQELKELLEARSRDEADFVLVDVRETYEYEVASIEGAELVPLGQLFTDAAREILPPQERVIVHCHHDGRSRHAAEVLRSKGWEDVVFVRGGIDAWSTEVDPSVTRY
ncbi:ThiF family adenylyltransferase [Herbiconiux sp. CPCC 203407]|uniref:ThiF family adenylyltransferase n=1 Tax=Herbiconiux oxytropis TaxID=2970915 RepID=A0AA41XG40_9MICO|nr:ThiF family adenylyltransferase [Herbiconiux oxytropis]MCS5722483.1 ThiF family adenylyltransferase [Herbiconiux oxytropis]MCS5727584.1 ThiF family adenylyltransferase [Herbiconiux oxytropis]